MTIKAEKLAKEVYSVKRIFKIAIGSLTFALVPSLPALAAMHSGSNPKVIFQKAPITNPATLFYDAQHGISAVAHSPFHLSAAMINQRGKNVSRQFGVQTFSTTQIVKKVQLSNGIKQDYVTTGFAVANTGSDPSYNNTNWDSTGAVEAYGTIYWDNVISQGRNETLLSKVTGGWNNNDNLITLQNPTVNFGEEGVSLRSSGGTYNTSNQYIDGLRPFSWPFTYYAPSSWHAIETPPVFRIFGQYTSVTLVRGSSSWSLTLTDEYNN